MFPFFFGTFRVLRGTVALFNFVCIAENNVSFIATTQGAKSEIVVELSQLTIKPLLHINTLSSVLNTEAKLSSSRRSFEYIFPHDVLGKVIIFTESQDVVTF